MFSVENTTSRGTPANTDFKVFPWSTSLEHPPPGSAPVQWLWNDNFQKINVLTPGSFCVLEVRRCQVNFSYGYPPQGGEGSRSIFPSWTQDTSRTQLRFYGKPSFQHLVAFSSLALPGGCSRGGAPGEHLEICVCRGTPGSCVFHGKHAILES